MLSMWTTCLWRGAVLAIAIALTAGTAGGETRAAHSSGGLIVFEGSRPDRTSVIEVVRPDGTGLAQPIGGRLQQSTPRWSPDGAWLAFDTHEDPFGAHTLSLVRFGDRRITKVVRVPGTGNFANPAWSPDGKRIAFGAWGNLGDSARERGIYLVNRNGTNLHRLAGTSTGANLPSWSPDGTAIAYRNARGIAVIGLNGQSRHQLTTDRSDFWPSWSPDGRLIVFSREDEAGNNTNIWLMNADGSGQRQLTHVQEATSGGVTTYVSADDPAWSPDGGQILFTLSPNETGTLWVMNADGSGARCVLPGLMDTDLDPSWRP